MGVEKRLSERDKELLYGLVRLHQQGPRLVQTLALAVTSGESLGAALAVASGGEPEGFEPGDKEVWKDFRRALQESEPLRALLAGLGGRAAEGGALRAEALKVSTFARVADLRPGGREVLGTQDGPFLNVLAAALDRHMTGADAERLLAEDLARFLKLLEGNEGLAGALNDLERKPYWHAVLASVEDKDDYTAAIEDGGLRAAARRDLEEVRKAEGSSGGPPRRVRLDSTFRLSRMPRRLFRLAWESRQSLAVIPPGDEPEEDMAETLGLTETPSRHAQIDEARGAEALRLLRESADTGGEVEWIVEGIRLRFAVARHLLAEREFAKLDALEYKWPEAARVLASGPDGVEGLIAVESYFLGRPPGTPAGADAAPTWKTAEERRLYEMCAGDAGLQSFLRLRPHFKEIDRKKLLERRLAFTFEPAAPLTPAAAATTAAATPPTADAQPARVVTAPESAGPLEISLTITHEADPPGPGVFMTEGVVGYRIEVQLPRRGFFGSVVLDARAFVREQLDRSGLAGEFSDSDEWYMNLTRGLSGISSDPSYQFADVGRSLYDRFLGQPLPDLSPDLLAKELTAARGVRVVVNTDAREVSFLPWEWLVLPGQDKSLLLGPDNSLIRTHASAKAPQPPREDLYPLRVTTPFSGLVERPQEAENRLTLLRSMFLDSGAVKLMPGDLRQTTASEVLRDLENFRPHVLHFEAPAESVGDAAYHPIFLLFDYPGYVNMRQLYAENLGSTAKEVGVRLMTFGNNHRGGFVRNDLLRVVARLVRDGLPAAVAATRPVEEVSAMNFWRGFYRAWLNGRSVEEAVAGARREIARGDWSAFALFGDPAAVGRLRLPRAA